MSNSAKSTTQSDQANADSIAGDILNLFKSGLTIALLYAAVIPLTIKFENGQAIAEIFNSHYTALAVLFYGGSMTTCVISYASARRLSYEDDPNSSLFTNKELVQFHYPTMILFGLVISVTLGIFGIVQGWYEIYDGVSGQIPIWFPLLILFGSIGYLFVSYAGTRLLIWFVKKVNSWIDKQIESILNLLWG